MLYLQTDKNIVAFNVYRCPVAEFFISHGLSELCVSAFCDLDYPLADIWDVTLDRPQTIAGGNKYCDFCFRS